MTYSRAVAVLCFVVIMLLTALTPLAWKHPPLASGPAHDRNSRHPSRPGAGWNRRGEETLMRTRYIALAATFILAAALAATILLTSNAGPQPTSAGQTATAPAEPQQAAATPQAAQPAPTSTVTIPPVERQQCVNGTALAAHSGHRALADDCALLLAAKDALAGTATLNWSATTAITDWTGVTVGSSNSDGRTRVTHLNLDSMSLNGSIPVELSELSALRKLRLGGNQLTGTIPAELGRLTELWQLDLGRNQLTGAIPPELGSIGATLTILQLNGPNPLPTGIGLTGSIPHSSAASRACNTCGWTAIA